MGRASKKDRRSQRSSQSSQYRPNRLTSPIQDYRKPKEELVREPLKPLNKRQADYIRAILQGNQVFTLGPAGTGKTFIAATIAADLLLAGDIEKIVLTRPAVGVDEEHGFLPGDIGKKIAPWVVPFTEVMQKRLGKDRFRRAMSEGQIEIAPIAYMRGRTFDKALIFLDEAQNTTYSQIKMFLTRIGEGSKVIVNGDIRQTDLKIEEDGVCGLSAVLTMVEHLKLPVPVIEFTNDDVVRSGICKLWAEAFADFEDEADAGEEKSNIGFIV